ncbi:MAG: 6-phosphogluconolactonase, partial [Bacteroidales bacterium]
MRIVIKKDPDEIGTWTASYIINKIKKAKPTKEKPFVLGLPTGSSPLPVYKEFIKRNKDGEISFQNVITFNMDEYVGIEENHPQSYHHFMYENLFNHIDIPRENINILNGNA